MTWMWGCNKCHIVREYSTEEEAKTKRNYHMSTRGCMPQEQEIVDATHSQLNIRPVRRKHADQEAMIIKRRMELPSEEEIVSRGNEEMAMYLRNERTNLNALFVGISIKNGMCPICRNVVGDYEELYSHYMRLHQDSKDELAGKTLSMLQQCIRYMRSRGKNSDEVYGKRCEVIYNLNRDLPMDLVTDMLEVSSNGKTGIMAYIGMVVLDRVPPWAKKYVEEDLKVEV